MPWTFDSVSVSLSINTDIHHEASQDFPTVDKETCKKTKNRNEMKPGFTFHPVKTQVFQRRQSAHMPQSCLGDSVKIAKLQLLYLN